MNRPLPTALDPKILFSLYSAGEHEKLSDNFLEVFKYFSSIVYTKEKVVPGVLYPFLKAFFTLFTQPDYIIPEKHLAPFILQNTLVSNLTAMSPFHNTDAFLEIVRHQPSNFIKILTLYSARNTLKFDRRGLFKANTHFASLWYNQFCEIYKTGLVRDDIIQNLREHLSHHDDHMIPAMGIMEPYFSSTYIDGNIDRYIKPFLNQIIKHHTSFKLDYTPDPKKIAVISDCWYTAHSVYRNYAAYVKELKKHYHLTLFHIISQKEKLDTSMFDAVHQIKVSNGVPPAELASGNFQLVYFPDVGMTDPSLIFSNCRIAPIQICSPGHSVSTWGADIDYYISGADVEVKESPENNYSERLVLLPGMGVIHNHPRYVPVNVKNKTSEILINCPWSAHKTCASFLSTLRIILERASKPVRLRLSPGAGVNHNNAYLPFIADLRAALGESVAMDVSLGLPYEKYMQQMEEGDLTLDSFHFAGCNGIADSLFLRKPTVVWEGDKWYNRIGPAMLRSVGMDEFICTNEDEYIEKALLLIDNEKKRAKVKATLEAADLDAAIFSTEHAPAFCRAVDYLIANHEDLKKQGSKAPIFIDDIDRFDIADQAPAQKKRRAKRVAQS